MIADKTAWMIREDGMIFPCDKHVYGSNENVETTLLVAEWLYKNTLHDKTKEHVLALVAAYGISINPKRNGIRNILIKIKESSYSFLNYEFICSIAEKVPAVDIDFLDYYNRQVNKCLNQEFLRARYGGLHSTTEGNKGMYYKISADDFKQWDIIQNHLESYTGTIEHITIVRDFESTGQNYFYCDKAENMYDRYPMSRIQFSLNRMFLENFVRSLPLQYTESGLTLCFLQQHNQRF